jgi:uncharacterized zinc-type alcohol dehydrogenase-like protein
MLPLSINGTLVLPFGYLGGLDPILNTVTMIMGRKSVAGSLIGGGNARNARFLWRTQYSFDIEIIKMHINTAYDRVKSDVNTVSYIDE